MNELIKAQRKAIQHELDKLKKEKNLLERYIINEDINDMESELTKMLNPKKVKL